MLYRKGILASFLIFKNIQLLYANPETKRVLRPVRFISFWSAINLKTFFAWFKVYLIMKKLGSAKCNSEFFLDINEMDTLESSQTNEKCKINHSFNCNDKCSIYLLICKVYGLQYLSSTTGKLHFRWNNYKEENR